MRHVLLSLTLLILVLAPTRVVSGQDALLGLWGGTSTTPMPLHGQLVVRNVSGTWTASVGGIEAVGAPRGDTLTVTFAGGRGELRVQGLSAERGPRAFWLQPAGNGRPFAIPIQLAAAGAAIWRGLVTPVPEEVALYLQVRAAPDGTLRGVFQNPDFNWSGGMTFTLIPRGDRLALIDPEGRERFTQPYDAEGQTITFDFGSPLILRPILPDQATGFSPRIGHSPYQYRIPPDLGDGWESADAGRMGIDDERLASLVRAIASSDPVNDTTMLIHSVVVARHGRLVLDEYFRGYAPDRLHDLRSASKTFTSVMLGAAMRDHTTLGVDSRLRTIFTSSDIDTTITLGNLLTHSSGLACDDDDDTSPGREDLMQGSSNDWYGYALALPLVRAPGSRYAYCSAGINLVGGAIAAVTGSWLPEYFDAQVAEPLEIEHYAMNLMPDGQGYSAGGVQMRPRDFLKFGELYLRGGEWHGSRVVSEEWVQESTAWRINRPDGSTDGYGWHRHLLQVAGREYESFEASGNGGQFMLVVPALDIVVVVTAGNYGQYGIWRRIREELIPRGILSAVVN